MNNLITITESALNELKRIAIEEKRQPRVRIALLGGGCSGMTIDMSFTKFPKDDEFDLVFIEDEVEFIVDDKSAIYIKDATLDFSGGVLTKGFKWEFPLSTGGCGCGTSFSF